MRPEDLHERRAQAGITIKRLSEISGVSESTIGRIEHGYRGARERTLRQLEQALDESGRGWAELLVAAKEARDELEQYVAPWMNQLATKLDEAIQKIEGR